MVLYDTINRNLASLKVRIDVLIPRVCTWWKGCTELEVSILDHNSQYLKETNVLQRITIGGNNLYLKYKWSAKPDKSIMLWL